MNNIKISNKIKPFNKKIVVDGDKSISIRWLLLASQATGKSKAYGILKSEDIYNTFSEYITIGYEKDLIIKLILSLKNRSIDYIDFLDDYYEDVWKYCDKGFFNFKKNFNIKYI